MDKAQDVALLARFLRGYSAEVTNPSRTALDDAASLMPQNAPVYIAALAKHTTDHQVHLAREVRDAGLRPVPHIVARHIESTAALDEYLQRMATEAEVDRALVLGGDRDTPKGCFGAASDLLKTGLFPKHGIKKVAFAGYPEGHPKISDQDLEQALREKIAVGKEQGLDMRLITQLCFDADAIIRFVRALRTFDESTRVRIGVSGPVKRATLIKFAAICGVGASLRTLRDRPSTAKKLLAGETPDELLTQLGRAQEAEPKLGIIGPHFYTFSALRNTIVWAEKILESAVVPDQAVGG
ncbi:MAG: methylenetetrahydrofolate reductase [Pseudomonadota bacterium]